MMKYFNIIGGPLKNLIFRGGSRKTKILGELPKGGLGQFPDLRG